MDRIGFHHFGKHENPIGLSLLGFFGAHEICAFACAHRAYCQWAFQVKRLRAEFAIMHNVALNAALPECQDDGSGGHEVADAQIDAAEFIRDKVRVLFELMGIRTDGSCSFPNDIREIVGYAGEVVPEDIFVWIATEAEGMSRSAAELLNSNAWATAARGIREGCRYINRIHDCESSHQSSSMPTSMNPVRGSIRGVGRRARSGGGGGDDGEVRSFDIASSPCKTDSEPESGWQVSGEASDRQKRIAKALPENTALVEFMVGDVDSQNAKRYQTARRYLASVLLPGSDTVHIIGMPLVDDVRTHTSSFNAFLSRGLILMSRFKGQYLESGNYLRSSLWDPLVGIFGSKIKHVYIVPAGEIRHVAFAGLPCSFEGDYVVDCGISVQHLPCSNFVLQHASQSILELDEPLQRSCVFSDAYTGPDICKALDYQFRRLPGAAAEGRCVHRLLLEVEAIEPALFNGFEATAKEFLSITSPPVLHIALNAFGPGLIMDRVVTTYEISRMDLRATQLVVLTSCPCETSGDQEGHEEQLGFDLAQSFLCAGAANVIASTCKVSDVEGFKFITTFYEELLNPHRPLDAASALAAAQRKFAVRPAARCVGGVHTMSWAGWLLYGTSGHYHQPPSYFKLLLPGEWPPLAYTDTKETSEQRLLAGTSERRRLD